MKILNIVKSKITWLSACVAVAGTLALPNCGGGASGGSKNKTTVRPKSLNGLELALDNNAASIQFVRSAASSSAINNGEIEEGAVRFSQISNIVSRQMIDGTATDVYYPVTTERITYRYRALNDTSGLLQIVAARAGYTPTGTPSPNVNRIFYYSSTDTVSITNYFLTFSTDGNSITNVEIRVAPNTISPDNFTFQFFQSPLVGWVDVTGEKETQESVTYLVEGQLRLTSPNGAGTGSLVPVNYDFTESDDNGGENTDSTIAVNSLDAKTIFFLPDNPSFDRFSATHSAGVNNGIDFTEEGDVLLFDDENNVQIGSGDYTYDKIPGTDDAELVYSGDTGEDNVYILNFRSLESAQGATLTQRASGFYQIQGGLQDGETGFFFIRDATNLGTPNN